jgi:hypothetical protein
MKVVFSGAHDAARFCLPCRAMAGMPGSAGKCSRCLVPADGRRLPRRGTAVPYNQVSQTLPRQTRHCNTRRLFSTIMSRHPCDLSVAYSPDDPIRHERQFNFTAALVHAQRSQRRRHVLLLNGESAVRRKSARRTVLCRQKVFPHVGTGDTPRSLHALALWRATSFSCVVTGVPGRSAACLASYSR